MQPTRDDLRRHHGGGTFSNVTIDLAELTIAKGHEGYRFETDAWFGGDINRLALKAEGEGTFGDAIEGVDLKALYSRAIGPYFNFQSGLRQEIGDGPDRTHAVIGIEGLAPYWFEVDAYLSLSTQGELRARASAEYDQRLTQRLILQPKIEFDLSAQDIRALGIGAGLSSAEAGLRLRYEIARVRALRGHRPRAEVRANRILRACVRRGYACDQSRPGCPRLVLKRMGAALNMAAPAHSMVQGL